MGRYGGYEDQEFVAEFYDGEYANLNRRDVEFFVDYSRKTEGKTLELGCGTGRVLIPTVLAGCEITGLDLSPYMLKKCHEKLAELPAKLQKNIELIQGDMTDFSTGEKYPLVTIPFRPFQHLMSIPEQKSCLFCTYKHLEDKGKLVFDVFHPFFPRLIETKYLMEMDAGLPFKLSDGRIVRRTQRIAAYHRTEQYNDCELIYYVKYPDGTEERLVHEFKMRYFYRYEIEHLLSICGFKIVELFGDFNRSEFSNDSPEMIFVAEKIV